MNLIESFRIAISALRVNKLRAFLTMLGIIIGVASVVLLMALGVGLRRSIEREFERLGTNSIYVIPGNIEEGFGGARGFRSNKLKFSDVDALRRKADHVVAVSGGIESAVAVSYKGETSKVVNLLGVDSDFLTITDYKVSSGRAFTKSENSAGKKVALVGQRLVERFFEGNNPLGKEILVKNQRYKIIGVLDKRGSLLGQDQDNVVILPLESARRQLGFEKPSWIIAKVDEAQNIEKAKLVIRKIMRERLSDDDFSVLTSEETLNVVDVILGIVTSVLAGIAAISLLVGGIGISNIMLVSVTERTKEIGLRKAVGATPLNILTQFLIEAVTLSLLGGLIGLVVAALGTMIISRLMPAAVTGWAVVMAFGFSFLVGVVFGVAPAVRAARLNPIDALRYE